MTNVISLKQMKICIPRFYIQLYLTVDKKKNSRACLGKFDYRDKELSAGSLTSEEEMIKNQ